MLNNEEIERYQRHLTLGQVGEKGQEKLRDASVLIVGLGGLGCPVLQYLCAAGVGKIGMVDFDQVELSNLQRQVLYTASDVGQNKALTAKSWAQRQNPGSTFLAYPEKLTSHNVDEIFNGYEIIVDGTDNFEAKYLINDACVLTDKPFVSASVYKFEGQLSVFNYQGGPTYRCLFPEHHRSDPNNCAETGVLGVLPGVLGVLQAAEVLKIILGIGSVLSGKLKIVDLLGAETHEMTFERDQSQVDLVRRQGLKNDRAGLAETCEMNLEGTLYLDIRERQETPDMSELGALRMPLSEVHDRLGEIPRDRSVVIFCQTGRRSAHLVEHLSSEHGFTNLINLKGGIVSLLKR